MLLPVRRELRFRRKKSQKTEEVQEESSETDVDDKEIKAHDISEELEEPDFLSGDIKDIKVADPKPDEEPKKGNTGAAGNRRS